MSRRQLAIVPRVFSARIEAPAARGQSTRAAERSTSAGHMPAIAIGALIHPQCGSSLALTKFGSQLSVVLRVVGLLSTLGTKVAWRVSLCRRQMPGTTSAT